MLSLAVPGPTWVGVISRRHVERPSQPAAVTAPPCNDRSTSRLLLGRLESGSRTAGLKEATSEVSQIP